MKGFLAVLLCIIPLLFSACVKRSDDPAMIPPVVPTETKAEEQDANNDAFIAVSVPLKTDFYYLDDGTELFSYSYQDMDFTYPNEVVADKVKLDFMNRVNITRSESENLFELAQNDYAQRDLWFPYFYRVNYNPTRIDRSILSLYGMQNSFSGGMHGNISCIAANYDLTSGDPLTLGSIMHGDAKKEDFIQLVIASLKESADDYYLYDDYEVAVHQRLCGDENLYEDFFFTDTGLNFFFSPYEIAPYASGIITVEIPYSDLNGLIYDGYFPPKQEAFEGTIKTGLFMETDMERFANMVEVVLPEGEQLYVIYTDSTAHDVKVSVLGDQIGIPDHTVFVAQKLTEQDALVLHVPIGQENNIFITYQSSGTLHRLALAE